MCSSERQKTPLSKCFPEYTGGSDVQVALDFIKQQFQSKLQEPKQLHFAYVSARFKKEVKWAWDEVKVALAEQYKTSLTKAQKHIKELEASHAPDELKPI